MLATENIYHVCWLEFHKLITIYTEMLDSEATLLPPSSTVGPFSLAVKWLALHQKFMAMLYMGGAGGAHSVALWNLKPFLYDAIFLSLAEQIARDTPGASVSQLVSATTQKTGADINIAIMQQRPDSNQPVLLCPAKPFGDRKLAQISSPAELMRFPSAQVASGSSQQSWQPQMDDQSVPEAPQIRLSASLGAPLAPDQGTGQIAQSNE